MAFAYHRHPIALIHVCAHQVTPALIVAQVKQNKKIKHLRF